MPEKRPITFFIPTLDGGGAERVIVNLVNGLDSGDRPVELLLFNRQGVYLEQVSESVPVTSLKASSRWTRVFMLIPMWLYLRRVRPSVLIVSGHSAFFVAWIACWFMKTRLMVIVHNTVSRELGVSKKVAKWLYRYADQVIAVSNGVALDIRDYADLPKAKIKTIYNPVDANQISQMAQELPAHPWFQDLDAKVLVSVGSLSAQKNYPLLFKAFQRAKQKDSSLRLVILGEGSERTSLQELAHNLGIEKDVAMPGFEQNPYACMNKAHRFVLSSSFEGFGMVLVEALCAGARVISTDCPSGPAEILQNGRWGVLVLPDNVAALTEAMLLTKENFPDPADSIKRGLDFDLQHSLAAYREVIDA